MYDSTTQKHVENMGLPVHAGSGFQSFQCGKPF